MSCQPGMVLCRKDAAFCSQRTGVAVGRWYQQAEQRETDNNGSRPSRRDRKANRPPGLPGKEL
ncbi:MAG: hypothetical protein LBQ54_08155 [Planctomycetaceae bacterium]|nr:hypothetical protein [Planctomycetaceae bacterium]